MYANFSRRDSMDDEACLSECGTCGAEFEGDYCPQCNKPTCKLIGEDGNVFLIIGRVQSALRRAGQRENADKFLEDATNSHSYDEVLQLAMKYVEIE